MVTAFVNQCEGEILAKGRKRDYQGKPKPKEPERTNRPVAAGDKHASSSSAEEMEASPVDASSPNGKRSCLKIYCFSIRSVVL